MEAKVGGNRIWIINGYGPQEDEDKQKILSFWQTIEKEVSDAKDEGCMVIVEMDANAKVGNVLITLDPNKQTNSGIILVEMNQRHNRIIDYSSMQWSDNERKKV